MLPAREPEPVHDAAPRCRACGGAGRPVFSKRGFVFAHCSVCDCRFVADAIPDLVYDEGYFGGRSFGGYPDYLRDRELLLSNFARRVRWLRPHARGARLLDVGAAYGFLVEAARREGFDAIGLEPAQGCVAWARRELGVEMVPGSIERASFAEESFDVVTLLDVIEHVVDPALALRQVRRWLRPGGLVVIETGDYQGLLARVCGSRWYYYDPPQHLTYFSRLSLERLLRRTGFEAPSVVGHLGRSVSVRNFSFQLGRALGASPAAEFCRSLARSSLGAVTFGVPDRGNVFTVAARAC